MSPSNSRVDGSIQCTSSNTANTGCWLARWDRATYIGTVSLDYQNLERTLLYSLGRKVKCRIARVRRDRKQSSQ